MEWEHTPATFIAQLALIKKSVTPPVLEGSEFGTLMPGALGREGDARAAIPIHSRSCGATCEPLHLPHLLSLKEEREPTFTP